MGTGGREPVGAAWGGSTVFPGLHTGIALVSDANPAVQGVVPLSPRHEGVRGSHVTMSCFPLAVTTTSQRRVGYSAA